MTIYSRNGSAGFDARSSTVAVLLALALAGCGGGGDSSAPAPTPTPAPVNQAPRAVATVSTDAGAPSLGAEVILTGAGSTDPEGAALAYGWTLVSRPADSKVALASANTVGTQFVPDMLGTYVVRLRATDPAGAYNEQELKVEVANHLPTPVLDKSAVTVLTDGSVQLSAALSYDVDGDPLTYAWSLDSRPAGSTVALADSAAATLSFVPDRPGDYVVLVKVSDGKRVVTSRVSVRALAQATGSVSLSFAPLDARYSRSLDKLVTVSANPDALEVVDPFSGLVKSVILPAASKAMTLSTDGRTAAVLHEGALSIVDLDGAKVLATWPTGGSQTTVALSDGGIAYLTGQTGGQWVDEGITVINVRDGTRSSSNNVGFGYLYGTMHGVYSQKNGKGFLVSTGLSPVDITYYNVDTATGLVKEVGDSPYHGDYAMSAPLFLSAAEDLVFTGVGTYFRTDTLNYGGKLVLPGPLTALSQSANGETLAISAVAGGYPDYANTYPAMYQRFTGALMLPAGELAFPKLADQQSYGIGIFHSGADHHVALVQTGSASARAAGAKYYVIYR